MSTSNSLGILKALYSHAFDRCLWKFLGLLTDGLNLICCAVMASIWSAKGSTGRLYVLGQVVHILRPHVSESSVVSGLVPLAVELTSLGIPWLVYQLSYADSNKT